MNVFDAGLDRVGDPLRARRLDEQLEDPRVDGRAAEDRRAAAEPVVAGLVRVARGDVGGVGDVERERDVGPQRDAMPPGARWPPSSSWAAATTAIPSSAASRRNVSSAT